MIPATAAACGDVPLNAGLRDATLMRSPVRQDSADAAFGIPHACRSGSEALCSSSWVRKFFLVFPPLQVLEKERDVVFGGVRSRNGIGGGSRIIALLKLLLAVEGFYRSS